MSKRVKADDLDFFSSKGSKKTQEKKGRNIKKEISSKLDEEINTKNHKAVNMEIRKNKLEGNIVKKTFEMSVELERELKIAAAMRGVKQRDIIIEAIQKEVKNI